MEIVKFPKKKDEWKKELLEGLDSLREAVEKDEIDGFFVMGLTEKKEIFRWQYLRGVSNFELLGLIENCKLYIWTREIVG